jgi:hypothetical protein
MRLEVSYVLKADHLWHSDNIVRSVQPSRQGSNGNTAILYKHCESA